tara:strand:+ start:16912 stop:17703 length:792 start_codon:yes stop_codon:yes gene_type:complete
MTAKLSTTQVFANNDQVTATSLNQVISGASLTSASADDSTVEIGSGVIKVKDSGVTSTQLATGAVTTAKIGDNAVTVGKIEQVSDGKILANLSGTDPADVTETLLVIGGSGADGVLFDNDDMLDNSDTAGGSNTRGATQQSIKAYVDSDAVKLAGFTPSTVAGGSTDGTGARHETITLPNGLVMKVGAIAPADPADTTTTVDFSALTDGADFPNAVYSANVTWEKTGSFATGQTAYIDSLNKENLVIDHTAGATLIHYVAYGR